MAYYELRKLLTYGRPISQCISMREGGKTFQALRLAFNTFRKRKSKPMTIFLQRYENQVSIDYLQGLTDEAIKVSRLYGWRDDIIYRGDDINAWIGFSNKEKVIIFKALSTALKKKKAPIHNVAWIIFDEFIINARAGETYLKDEIFRFNQLFSTVKRGYNDKTRAIFFGNAEASYNPYFAYYNVNKHKLIYNGIYAPRNEPYAIEIWDDEERRRELMNSPFYSMVKHDKDYTAYLLHSVFLGDRDDLYFKKLPGTARSLMRINHNGAMIGVWRYGDKLYISSKTGAGYKFVSDVIDVGDGYSNINASSFGDIRKLLKLKADGGKILFENPTIENTFLSLYIAI